MRGIRYASAAAAVLFSLSACAPTRDHSEVSAVADQSSGGAVVARVEYTFRSDTSDSRWLLADDGDIASIAMTSPGVDMTAKPTRLMDCAGSDCYRVVPGALRVEQSRDAGRTFNMVWEVSGDNYAQLAKSYPDLGDPAAHLSSRSVVVHAVAGGHVVFVANGRDGVLYRDVGGAWHRLGTPKGGEGYYFDPPPRLATDPAPFDPTGWVVAVVVTLVLAAGGVIGAFRRSLLPARAGLILALAGVAGLAAGLAWHIPDVGMFPGFFFAIPAIMIVATVGAISAAVVAAVAPRRSRPPRTGRPVPR